MEFDTGVQRSRVKPLECGQNVVSLRNTQHAFTEDRVVGHQKASMPIEVSEIVRAVGLEPTVGEPTRS